jgi:hypothetical protein
MMDHNLGVIEESLPHQSKPSTQLHILSVRPKVRIEAAHFA